MKDPRPDLKYDSTAWSKLLRLAKASGVKQVISSEVVGILHGFRCAGLRLHYGRRGYVLRPDFGNDTSWATKEEYIVDRDKWLVPWQEEITMLLQTIGRNGVIE